MQKVVIFLVGGLILSSSVTILARPARGSRKSSQERQPVDRSEPTVDTKKKTSLTELEMSDTQKENINKLKTDLMNIKEGSEVTEAQKEAFKNDLLAIADGATRPDPALTEQLVNDLTQAIADGDISSQEKMQLAADVQKVMNSANIPMEEVNQAIADIQVILEASGISQSDVQTIVDDLKAIASEAQKK